MDTDLIFVAVLGYSLVAACALVYAIRIRRAAVLDPVVQFIGFFSLFTLPLPVRVLFTQEIEGDVTEHLPQLIPYMPTAVVLCTIGLIFFVWGYYSSAALWLSKKFWKPRDGNHPYVAFVSISAISLFLISQLATDGIIPFILMGYNSSAEMFGKGYLAVGFPWLFVGCMFLLLAYARKRKTRDLLLFVAVFTLLCIVELVMGNRSKIMYMGLTVIIFWHHAVNPVRMKTLLSVGAISFVALNVVGYLRTSGYEDVSSVFTRAGEQFSKVQSDGDAVQSMFYTLTTGEFVVPFETLPEMIRSIPNHAEPLYGWSILRTPTYFIPSAIYPQRPLPLANWYMQEFYGGGYGLNEGRAFFAPSEGYLNFGPAGVFVVMLGWGIFLGACKCYSSADPSLSSLILYALTVAFVFRGIAGDFSSMLVGLPEQCLSAAVFGVWLSRL